MRRAKNLLPKARKVYRFGFGQSPFPVPEKIVSTLKDNVDKKDYLSMQGLPELREAIATHLSTLTKT